MPPGSLLSLVVLVASAAPGGIDPLSGVVHDGRSATGIPLGALGTGAVHVQTDGSIDTLTCNNNPDRPLPAGDGTFLAVRTWDGRACEVRLLELSPRWEFDGVQHVACRGLYPGASFYYRDPALPLDLRLEASAILAPPDPADSSLPAVIWTFYVANPLPQPQQVTILLSWENLLGQGAEDPDGPLLRDNCVQLYHATEALFGLRYRNLIRRTDAIRCHLGEYALAVVKQEGVVPSVAEDWDAGREGTQLLHHLAANGDLDGWWSGSAPGRHPAGAVAARLTLDAGETAGCTFVSAWYLPETPRGPQYYAAQFTDAWSVAEYVAENRHRLARETRAWQQRVQRSNLPVGLERLLVNTVGALATRCRHTADGRVTFCDGDLETGGGFIPTFFPDLHRGDLLSRVGALRWSEVGVEACDLIAEVLRASRWSGDRELLQQAFAACAEAGDRLSAADADGDRVPDALAGYADRWCVALDCLAEMARRVGEATAAATALQRADDARTLLRERPLPAAGSEPATAFWYAGLTGIEPPLPPQTVSMWADTLSDACRNERLLLPPTDTIEATAACRLPFLLGPAASGAGHAGRADVALDWAIRAAHAVELAGGSPFEVGCRYRAQDGRRLDQGPCAGAMTAWNLFGALAGLDLDVPRGRVRIAPVLPPGMDRLVLPVFTPRWWAWLEWSEEGEAARLELRVERLIEGEALDLAVLATRPLPGAPAHEARVEARLNDRPLRFDIRRGSDQLELAFQPPLRVKRDDRLMLRVQR